MSETIILATSNRHKLLELSPAAADAGIELQLLSDLDSSAAPEENGTTFEANARIKAEAAFSRCKRPVLAEDSGLVVKALHGEPGIYSARYCNAASDDARTDCLLSKMAAFKGEERYAEFQCCMIFIDRDGTSYRFDGVCEGEITTEKRGENGFGYDPVFYIPELNATMAELEDFEKQLISHRAHAFASFLDFYRNKREI